MSFRHVSVQAERHRRGALESCQEEQGRLWLFSAVLSARCFMAFQSVTGTHSTLGMGIWLALNMELKAESQKWGRIMRR